MSPSSPGSTPASLAGRQAGPGRDPAGFAPLGRRKKIKATGSRRSKFNNNDKAQHLVTRLLAGDPTPTRVHAREAPGSVAQPALS